MAEAINILDSPQPLDLECGVTLPGIQIAYSTYGKLNEAADNVIWVNHALTANSDVAAWWPGFFGEGNILDPENYFIVCANMLGSCYGSTNPNSINPNTGLKYGADFPLITIQDIIQAHERLREALGIRSIFLALGGSMGGQQTIEWAISNPTLIKHAVLIACNAFHSPWGIAFNEAQRLALQADPTLYDDAPLAGAKGMASARALAMISYRNYLTFAKTQPDALDTLQDHRASTYQRYQGFKLSQRFTAPSYVSLSKTMDSHQVGRNRGSTEAALATVQAKTLVVGIDTDILFPVNEQSYLAQHIPGAHLEIIHSLYGHDGFLLEYELIGSHIRQFIPSLSTV